MNVAPGDLIQYVNIKHVYSRLYSNSNVSLFLPCV